MTMLSLSSGRSKWALRTRTLQLPQFSAEICPSNRLVYPPGLTPPYTKPWIRHSYHYLDHVLWGVRLVVLLAVGVVRPRASPCPPTHHHVPAQHGEAARLLQVSFVGEGQTESHRTAGSELES